MANKLNVARRKKCPVCKELKPANQVTLREIGKKVIEKKIETLACDDCEDLKKI